MKIRIPIDKITVEHSLDIYDLMQWVLKREQKVDRIREHFWVLAMSNGNKILNLELITWGSDGDRLSTRPADVLAIPLQKQAAGVILVHNNPSGLLEASEADQDYTDQMIQACRIMKTPVLDHVIITGHSYMSFRDSGLLERLEQSLKYVPPYEVEEQICKMVQAEVEKIRQASDKKLKEGLEKGIQQGIKLGVEQGMHSRTLDIARNMLKAQEPTDKVVQFTGLTLQQIEKFLENMPNNF